MTVRVLCGDCRDVLKTLPDESVQCCVTSPPYWGLRDYGVDGQLGLEATPEEYVAHLVEVFREVRRVLRKDGTLWLNLGDTYWGGKGASNYAFQERRNSDTLEHQYHNITGMGETRPQDGKHDVLKPKDLVGIPWRVAFALQADGWYLRSDVIWAKPNPMPESVTDRPTKAHEYVFLLAKSPRYYYDADAVREPCKGTTLHDISGTGYHAPGQTRQKGNRNGHNSFRGQGANRDGKTGPALRDGRDMSAIGTGPDRNRRSVWTIATRPFSGAHFATFPPDLVRPCILAGTSERGRCPICGAPWERVVEKKRTFESGSGKAGHLPSGKNGPALQGGGETLDVRRGPCVHAATIGWRPTCDCPGPDGDHPGSDCADYDEWPTVPCVVLDPFGGAGTVAVVAKELGRDAVLIELSQKYVDEIAGPRIARTQPALTMTEEVVLC